MTEDGRELCAIVVIDERGAIGNKGGLLCHLPADLKHFKTITMGHSIVMGRHTLESFPKGPLPGRQNIVISRNPDYAPEGVTMGHSIPDALAAATMPGAVFVIGGAQIYKATFAQVDTLYLTRIHHTFDEADVFFPEIVPDEWIEVDREAHEADERNRYNYTFITLKRVKK
ncbi:MAG: dihydrofolate reductase [Muribaculaceae bacterium]|nr:dihydrofolate reductase [Muribaculaceae bacterium]